MSAIYTNEKRIIGDESIYRALTGEAISAASRLLNIVRSDIYGDQDVFILAVRDFRKAPVLYSFSAERRHLDPTAAHC